MPRLNGMHRHDRIHVISNIKILISDGFSDKAIIEKLNIGKGKLKALKRCVENGVTE